MPLVGIAEKIAFYGLLVVIFLSAIPYGSISPVYRSLVIVSICVIALIRIATGAASQRRPSGLIIHLPLAGILVLALVQVLPLNILGEKMLSLDPYETKIFIVTFAALLMLGEMLLYFTNSRQRLQTLIAFVMITGAAGGVFGLARHFIFHDNFAPYFPDEWQSFGFFTNRNHFALLMEMALGLTVGLVLKGRGDQKFRLFASILIVFFIFATITANSRGGMISIGAIVVFAAFAHIMTRGNDTSTRGSAHGEKISAKALGVRTLLATGGAVVIFAVFVFIVAFVGGDTAVSRLEKISGEVRSSEQQINRRAIWRASSEMIKENPFIGVGFGAYAVAFPAFARSDGEGAIEQAHNEYLEILANGGVISFALFAIFGFLVIRRALENFASHDPLVRSSCFGALIGIFGVLVHSVVDFGLHVLVNAMIFTVLIVIAVVRIPSAPRRKRVKARYVE